MVKIPLLLPEPENGSKQEGGSNPYNHPSERHYCSRDSSLAALAGFVWCLNTSAGFVDQATKVQNKYVKTRMKNVAAILQV